MTSPAMRHRAPYTYVQRLYNAALALEGYRYQLNLTVMKKLQSDMFDQMGVTGRACCIMSGHDRCLVITRLRRTVHISFREKSVNILLEIRSNNTFPHHKWGSKYTNFFGRYRD